MDASERDSRAGAGLAERALEPDLPIVDAHFHVWERSPFGPGHAPYSAKSYFDDLERSGHNVVGSVYVEALSSYRDHGPEELRSVGETEYADTVVQEGVGRRPGVAVCAGIVINADLASPNLDEILDAHIAASPHVKGVRLRAHQADGIPARVPTPPGLLRRPTVLNGVRRLRDRNLSFDCTVYQTQLDDVAVVAKAAPDTTIVLNHLGGPLARHGVESEAAFAAWRSSLAALAPHPNVKLKLGGLHQSSTGLLPPDPDQPYSAEQMIAAHGDYILAAIDLFGPERCMFESNFPVDKAGISFTSLWNGFKRLTWRFTGEERADLFAGAALRAYRLS